MMPMYSLRSFLFVTVDFFFFKTSIIHLIQKISLLIIYFVVTWFIINGSLSMPYVFVHLHKFFE